MVHRSLVVAYTIIYIYICVEYVNVCVYTYMKLYMHVIGDGDGRLHAGPTTRRKNAEIRIQNQQIHSKNHNNHHHSKHISMKWTTSIDLTHGFFGV